MADSNQQTQPGDQNPATTPMPEPTTVPQPIPNPRPNPDPTPMPEPTPMPPNPSPTALSQQQAADQNQIPADANSVPNPMPATPTPTPMPTMTSTPEPHHPQAASEPQNPDKPMPPTPMPEPEIRPVGATPEPTTAPQELPMAEQPVIPTPQQAQQSMEQPQQTQTQTQSQPSQSFNPQEWDKQTKTLNKQFISTFSPRIFTTPFSYDVDKLRAKKTAEKKGSAPVENGMVLLTPDKFLGKILIEVQGQAADLTLNQVYTKLSVRPWPAVQKEIQEMEKELGQKPKEVYIWRATPDQKVLIAIL